MDETAPPAWVVTSQIEAMDLAPSGSYVSGVKVSFQTLTGVTGSVFVPLDQYQPELIRARIAARVESIMAVGELRG